MLTTSSLFCRIFGKVEGWPFSDGEGLSKDAPLCGAEGRVVGRGRRRFLIRFLMLCFFSSAVLMASSNESQPLSVFFSDLASALQRHSQKHVSIFGFGPSFITTN